MLSALSLVVLMSSIYVSHCAHKDRHKLVSRIQNYTLLRIVPEQVDETARLSFDAFGEHYEVELRRNNAVIPSSVAHTNVHPALHPTAADSCHYHGRVLNAPTESLVALSLCPGRGIRGHIIAFNETLIVRPSAYYLDLAMDALAAHSLTDELLLYRESDYDRPLVLDDEAAAAKPFPDPFDEREQMEMHMESSGRRRLAYSSRSPAVTKLALMIGPVRVANFKADYGSAWYSQLFLETADMVNMITAWYEDTNWGSMGGRGSLRVVLAEIFVIYEFEDVYRSMLPKHQCPASGQQDSSCYTKEGYSGPRCSRSSGQLDDSDNCAVNHGPWLDSIIEWVYANKNSGFQTTFDNIQFITDIKLKVYRYWNGNSVVSGGRVLGVAYPETMCTGARSLGLDSVQEEVGGLSEGARTTAHELGHNFGLYHDGQDGPGSWCAEDEGLMGYSDGVGFSRCSVASMEDYFEGDGRGMTCLSDSFDGAVVSNVNDGTVITRPPNNNPATPSPVYNGNGGSDSDSDDGCLTMGGFDDTAYDGAWSEVSGGFDGRAAYRRSDAFGATNYLFYYECAGCFSGQGTVRWVLGSDLPSGNSVSISLFCTSSSLQDCAGNWRRYESWGWTTVYGSYLTIDASCGGTGTGTGTGTGLSDDACSGYSCVFLASSGVGADGHYYATSACHNGERVYANSYGKYMCFHEGNGGRWLVTSEVCSNTLGKMLLLSGSTSTDVLYNDGYYVFSGSSMTHSSSIVTAQCSQGFEGDEEGETEEECEPETEAVCLHGMALADESGEDSFWASEGACSNGRAVYSLTVRNASATDEFSEVESVLYVHFADFLGESRWVLTEDGLSTARYLALCDAGADSLLECTAGAWSVHVELDDLVRDVLDESVFVTQGSCDWLESDSADAESEVEDSTVLQLVLALAVSLALLAVVSGVVMLRRRRRAKQVDTTMMAKEVAASTSTAKAMEVGDVSDEEEEDVEVEVEVEAAFARQANSKQRETRN